MIASLILGSHAVLAPRAWKGVAPWDFPDGPNPYPSAPAGFPPLPDPPSLVRSTSLRATTPSGVTVELVGISRRHDVSEAEPGLGDQPVWKADGSPYPWRPSLDGNGGWTAESLQDRGARYLEFRISGLDDWDHRPAIIGYVADGAKAETPNREFHGWARDAATGSGLFRTCVVVDDRRASHYRMGIARGAWQVATSVPCDRMRENRTLAQGPWGTLQQTKDDRRPFGNDEEKGYAVDLPTSTAPSLDVRIGFVDAEGQDTSPFLAARIVALTRPYEWIELSGVHYDPDPRLWERAYWGEEGLGAIRRVGATGLYAVQRSPDAWTGNLEVETYAPDGIRWRSFPFTALLGTDATLYGQSRALFEALLRLDRARVRPWTPAWLQGYAAASAAPGVGLGAPLPTRRPQETDARYGFPSLDSPYVQIAVRYPTGAWKKLAEWRVPSFHPRPLRSEETATIGSHWNLPDAFRLTIHAEGRVDAARFEDQGRFVDPVACPLVWPGATRDARLLARLRSGRRVVLLDRIGPGDATQKIEFARQGATQEFEAQAPGETLRLSDVEAFEIETRGFDAPRYLVAKVPPD